jgi:hypothetical protein
MVSRTFLAGGLAFLVWGCDPFAPGDPEAPTVAGTAQSAKRVDDVPRLWAKGLVEENTVQTQVLVAESFQGTSGSVPTSLSKFSDCLGKLASEGVDSASFAWRGTPSGTTDSVAGDVDWTLVKEGGTRFGGRATWSIVRDDAAEWRLARWAEPATSGNWSDACGGF